MLKKMTGILLFICLLAPVVTTFSYLHYHKRSVRKQIKHDMMKKLDKSSFIHFSFSKEEVASEMKWKHSKEFEYKGEMYDVVERNDGVDSVHFYVWWDHKETTLNLALNRVLSSTMNKDNETKKHQNSWIAWLKNIIPSQVYNLNWDAEGRTISYKAFTPIYDDVESSPSSPPPKVV